MILLLEIVFWLCVLLIAHSYVIFPALLRQLARNRSQQSDVYQLSMPDALPPVSIILAAYNEAKVIEQKILSTFNTSYPLDRIEMLIGSDASSDGTDEIIERYARLFPQIKLVRFAGRTGKAHICNQLTDKASAEIFILTDANVFFHPHTIFELVKHYHHPDIALVGGNIINSNLKKDGISVQEKTYLDRENRIKYDEGILWGSMIGAFGGCYSIRKSHYTHVPPRYFMDDFYITMHALALGGKAINELQASCEEDVSNKISEEFRRKVRISIGNWQNLSSYYRLLWPFWQGLGFCFLSHKVLRWITPILLIIMVLSNILILCLAPIALPLYSFLLGGQIVLMLLPLLDALLKQMPLHIRLLRFVSHFYLMNLALLIGLFRFLRGVDSNIWKPTERNQ